MCSTGPFGLFLSCPGGQLLLSFVFVFLPSCSVVFRCRVPSLLVCAVGVWSWPPWCAVVRAGFRWFSSREGCMSLPLSAPFLASPPVTFPQKKKTAATIGGGRSNLLSRRPCAKSANDVCRTLSCMYLYCTSATASAFGTVAESSRALAHARTVVRYTHPLMMITSIVGFKLHACGIMPYHPYGWMAGCCDAEQL